jgi:spore coat polysaccharide biosynthesis protein SpsF
VLVAQLTSDSRCHVFRGEEDDVLDRFYQCAERHLAQRVVRITADDPLKDPQIIERALHELDSAEADYCSNTIHPTYPEGLDVEVFSFDSLRKAWKGAKLASEREHVTPFMWKNPHLFRLRNFRYERDLSAWRWTVDKDEDLLFVRAVYGHFSNDALVRFQDVIAWLDDNPQVRAINSATLRNEGYMKSLIKEQSDGH